MAEVKPTFVEISTPGERKRWNVAFGDASPFGKIVWDWARGQYAFVAADQLVLKPDADVNLSPQTKKEIVSYMDQQSKRQ